MCKRTVRETFEDACPGLAAQLAFYFLLALFPALLFVVALISCLPIEPGLAAALGRLDVVVPPEVLMLVRRQLDQAIAGSSGGLLTLGIAGAVWRLPALLF